MKRLCFMVVLGVVATALLTGQAIDPAKKYEVTVGAYGDLEKAYKAVIATDDFKKKFPNVTLKFQTSDFGGHHNRLTTVIAAGEQTNDIEALEVGYIAQFVQAGGLTDLNAAPFNAKKLSKDLVKFAVSKDTNVVGALIAMPVDSALAVMFYRADLAKTAGLNMDNVANWDAYIAALKKLTHRKLLDAQQA